jgi:DNA polymerase-3 subunit alpha
MSLKVKLTKKQTQMAYVTLEDTTGSLELLVFEKALVAAAPFLQPDQAVIVHGRISAREEEEPKLMVDEAWPLNETYAQQYLQNRRSRDRGGFERRPRQEVQTAPQPQTQQTPAPAAPAPADDGRTLWIKVSCQQDERFRLVCEELERCPGNQKVILYLVHTKQRLAWQKGTHIGAVAAALEPVIGKENIVIK